MIKWESVALHCSSVLMTNCSIKFCFFICHSVTPDTLTDMANQMTEKVGLVHGLPYVADRQGFAATLEQVSAVFWGGNLFHSFLLAKPCWLKAWLCLLYFVSEEMFIFRCRHTSNSGLLEQLLNDPKFLCGAVPIDSIFKFTVWTIKITGYTFYILNIKLLKTEELNWQILSSA